MSLQGVKQLVSCLKQNNTLQKLDLENKVRITFSQYVVQSQMGP